MVVAVACVEGDVVADVVACTDHRAEAEFGFAVTFFFVEARGGFGGFEGDTVDADARADIGFDRGAGVEIVNARYADAVGFGFKMIRAELVG